MRIEVPVLLVLAVAAFGCGRRDVNDEVEPEEEVRDPDVVTLVGVVQFHRASPAIGGESDPTGYILTGDHASAVEAALNATGTMPEPGVQERIYLRRAGELDHRTLRMFVDKRIAITGRLDVVRAGGVETPERYFPVLDLMQLEPVE